MAVEPIRMCGTKAQTTKTSNELNLTSLKQNIIEKLYFDRPAVCFRLHTSNKK